MDSKGTEDLTLKLRKVKMQLNRKILKASVYNNQKHVELNLDHCTFHCMIVMSKLLDHVLLRILRMKK